MEIGKENASRLLWEKISLPSELSEYMDFLFSVSGDPARQEETEVKEITSWESTARLREYIKMKLEKIDEQGGLYPRQEDFSEWVQAAKGELKIKGKALFKGMRVVLTGRAEGPDLKVLIPLTQVRTLLQRLELP